MPLHVHSTAGERHDASVVRRIRVVAWAEPQALPRILNPFVLHGLAPRRLVALESEGLLTVRMEIANLEEQRLRIIAEKLRSSFLVTEVQVS